MNPFGPLTPDDFPLIAKGQFVYRRTNSSPMIGPVTIELAADLAARLNWHHLEPSTMPLPVHTEADPGVLEFRRPGSAPTND